MATPGAQQGLGPRPQLSDEVAARVREMIMDGRLRPGEFLRLERLALDFGISVTPVREALRSLRSEGFVLLEPRRGFVVAPLSRQDVRDLFLVQSSIASELAVRAATRVTADALRELATAQRGLERAIAAGRADLAVESQHAFHREVNRAAASPKLSWSLAVVSRCMPPGGYARLPDWPQVAVRDHQRVLEALRHGDEQAAGAEMRRHVVRAGRSLVAHLERRGMWPTAGLDEVSD
ncbi:GntR family transcriptional regulator [Actinomadura hibisca]|uniref:GntR family transcriptional regulator n=1 Tax=Actinomadura hibisca TaxID=68565 RepID=UPI000836566B|nr:GntR family transcriptional regulator [Actinomadura hibisca]